MASILRRQFCSPLYFAARQLVNASTPVNFPHTWISFCYINLPPSEALPQPLLSSFLSFPFVPLKHLPAHHTLPSGCLLPSANTFIWYLSSNTQTFKQINDWVNAFCQACLQLAEALLCCFIHPRWQTPQHLHTALVLGRGMGKR